MNNSGKASFIFLLLIPVFFVLALIVVDTIFNYVENNRFKTVTESIISEVMLDNEISVDDYKEEIKKRFERRGFTTEMLVVEASDYEVHVENTYNYFGIFSSLSNKKSVESEIKIFDTTFKVRKNSVARIKVTARFNSYDELKFEYTK